MPTWPLHATIAAPPKFQSRLAPRVELPSGRRASNFCLFPLLVLTRVPLQTLLDFHIILTILIK